MDINDKKTAVKRTEGFYDADFGEFGKCMKCGFSFEEKYSIHKFCPGCGRKITGIVEEKIEKLHAPFSDGDKKMVEKVFAGIATAEEFQEFQNKFEEQRKRFEAYSKNYNSACENLTNALTFRFNNLFGLDGGKTTFSKSELKQLVKEEVRKILHGNNH